MRCAASNAAESIAHMVRVFVFVSDSSAMSRASLSISISTIRFISSLSDVGKVDISDVVKAKP